MLRSNHSLLLLGLALAGCDSKATASDPAAPAPSRLSRELESCGATSQCAEGLRCLDQTCQREARSMTGDYLAARGARALAQGDVQGAVGAYAEAAATYQAEKVPVPPDLDCAQGQALVAARAEKDKAEAGARLLHRCLLAMPPGGHLRAAALAALTDLDRSGFDPRQLSRNELADLYLTRGPAKPDASTLAIAMTADPAPKGKSWPLIADRLKQADVRSALIACWDAAYSAHQQRELTSRLAFTVKYVPSEYDDEAGKYTFGAEPAAGASGAQADADACVKAAVMAPLAELKGLAGGFTATLTVNVK